MFQAVKIEQERRDSLRAPDIQFPDMLPLLEWTHLHGFWSTHRSKNPVWRNYDPFLTFKALLKNVRTDDAHWLHCYLPDQRYVLERNQKGNFAFLKPDSVFYPRRAHLHESDRHLMLVTRRELRLNHQEHTHRQPLPYRRPLAMMKYHLCKGLTNRRT